MVWVGEIPIDGQIMMLCQWGFTHSRRYPEWLRGGNGGGSVEREEETGRVDGGGWCMVAMARGHKITLACKAPVRRPCASISCVRPSTIVSYVCATKRVLARNPLGVFEHEPLDMFLR